MVKKDEYRYRLMVQIQKARLCAMREEEQGWGEEIDSWRRGADTPKASRGLEMGSGPLPNRLWSLGSVVRFPAGSRTEPQPNTDFSAFQASQTASRSDVCRKYCRHDRRRV